MKKIFSLLFAAVAMCSVALANDNEECTSSFPCDIPQAPYEVQVSYEYSFLTFMGKIKDSCAHGNPLNNQYSVAAYLCEEGKSRQYIGEGDVDGSLSFFIFNMMTLPETAYHFELFAYNYNNAGNESLWSAPYVSMTYNDNTTAIESMKMNSSEAVVYDLSGKRAERKNAGIYVVDGKKVIVK